MMDWTEKGSCIKCNRDGDLLVCNENGCPMAVHRKCMGCPARFDDMGNFYCPYCLYKRAMEETRQLKEKVVLAKEALSTFFDGEMADGNHENPKTQMPEQKELTCADSGSSLESDVENHSIHSEEHGVEKGFTSLQTTADLAHKDSDQLLVYDKIEGLLKRQKVHELINCDASKMIIVYQPQPISIVAHGADHASCNEEMATCRLDSVDVRTVHPAGVECQDDKFAQDRLQSGDLSANSVKKETLVNNLLNKSSTKKRKPLETCNENEDPMLEKAGETAVGTHLAPESQLHPKSSRGSYDSDSIVRDNHSPSTQWRNAKQKLTNVVEAQDGNSPRRMPAGTSSEGTTRPERSTEATISSKSGQLEESSRHRINKKVPSLNEKQRKLWSEEEEDMLKEGIQKFSAANKNIPWKKILEFGRHVFDPSRSPADLKDKWRNNLSKRS